jgi:hypothetical protein
MMSETTVQPEDLDFDNAKENAFFQEFMLAAIGVHHGIALKDLPGAFVIRNSG